MTNRITQAALLCAAATSAALLPLTAPAAAAVDHSVSAGAAIPSSSFAFVQSLRATCTHHVATTGSDSNSGTSTALAWRTPARAMARLRAGQTACVHSGTYDVDSLDPSSAGTQTAPIGLVAAPGEAQPVLRSTSTRPLVSFGPRDAFWVVQGFRLDKAGRGGATVQVLGSPAVATDRSTGPAHHVAVRGNVLVNGASGAAVLVRHASTDVLVQDNDISGQRLVVGGERRDANAVNLESTPTGQVARVRVVGNDLHHNGGDGVQCLGVADAAGARANDPVHIDLVDNRIHHNTENAVDIKSCQRVSIRGSRSPASPGRAADNTLHGYRPTPNARGNSANGDAIVLHYAARGVLIENTRIWDSCKGIGIGRSDLDGVRDVVVRRTLVFGLTSDGGRCSGIGLDLVLASRLDISHNTFAGIPSVALRLGSGGTQGQPKSHDVDVFENIVETSGAGRWFDVHRPLLSGFESDRNLFWNTSGSAARFRLDFSDGLDLERWRAATGQDLRSRRADPAWISAPTQNDFFTRAGSPARDRAVVVTGEPFCGSAPDIGFRESGC